MISSQKRFNSLIKVKKHELHKAIKDHVEWRKKNDPGATTKLLVYWYNHFTKYLYTLNQREFTLNNQGFGVEYVRYMLAEKGKGNGRGRGKGKKGKKGNKGIIDFFKTFQATLNRLDILHGFRLKELFRDFATVNKANEDHFLTNEEVKELMDLKVTDPKERITLDRFLVACFTGCRMSEVISVKVINDNTLQYTSVKTKKDILVPFSNQVRHLFINEEFKDEIPRWSHQGNPVLHKIFKRLKWNDTVKIYSHHGKVKTSTDVPRWKALTFHSSRKFYGKMLLDMDIPIYKVSQLLGHSSVVTTERYYASLTKNKMIDEVNDKINNF